MKWITITFMVFVTLFIGADIYDGQKLNERVDRIELQIDCLYEELEDAFDNVDYRLGELEKRTNELQKRELYNILKELKEE